MKSIAMVITLLLSAGATAAPVHVYGPGGPAPAIKEAAAAYRARTGTEVRVVAGPTGGEAPGRQLDADVIYSGSEANMTNFVKAIKGGIQEKTIQPLYLRASNILVRPGNPFRIRALRDLLRPGVRVLVVQGAGQTGMWEDMAGRTGDIRIVRALRANIVNFVTTSADAKRAWTENRSLDAWIIWSIWQKANPTLADAVTVEEPYRIYRDTGAGLTTRGLGNPDAHRFKDFLAWPAGARIFANWGWITPASAQRAAKRK